MILFVDDDEFGMKPYVLALEDEGYTVRTESTPDHALAVLATESSSVELVILDILMPVGKIFRPEDANGGLHTGYLLLDLLRKEYPRIPVIVLSITGEGESKAENVASERFLNKQNTVPDELLFCVQDVLGKKGD